MPAFALALLLAPPPAAAAAAAKAERPKPFPCRGGGGASFASVASVAIIGVDVVWIPPQRRLWRVLGTQPLVQLVQEGGPLLLQRHFYLGGNTPQHNTMVFRVCGIKNGNGNGYECAREKNGRGGRYVGITSPVI